MNKLRDIWFTFSCHMKIVISSLIFFILLSLVLSWAIYQIEGSCQSWQKVTNEYREKAELYKQAYIQLIVDKERLKRDNSFYPYVSPTPEEEK